MTVPNHRVEEYIKLFSFLYKKKKILTATVSVRAVSIIQGATALTRILSLPHSQAKFFVNWFIAPKQK